MSIQKGALIVNNEKDIVHSYLLIKNPKTQLTDKSHESTIPGRRRVFFPILEQQIAQKAKVSLLYSDSHACLPANLHHFADARDVPPTLRNRTCGRKQSVEQGLPALGDLSPSYLEQCSEYQSLFGSLVIVNKCSEMQEV